MHVAPCGGCNLVRNPINYFFRSGALEGMLAFTLLLLIPSDPKNSWFLGYSKTRWLLSAVLISAAAVFWLLSTFHSKRLALTEKLSNKIDGLLDIYGITLPVLLLWWVVFIAGPYLKLVTYLPSEAIKARLVPLLLYLSSRTIQLALVLTMMARSRAKGVKGWRLSRRNLSVILLSITAILVTAHISFFLIHELTQGAVRYREIWQLNRYFNLTYEMNLPTFYSVALLGGAGVLLGVIAVEKIQQRARFRFQWLCLSALLFYLAADELLGLHENLGYLADEYFGRENLVIQDWAYAGIVLVAVFGLLFWPFYNHLPVDHKKRFFLSAALYVGGFLGMEIIGSIYEIRNGIQAIPYLFFTTAEESLEMIGMIYFIHTLLIYLAEIKGKRQLSTQRRLS